MKLRVAALVVFLAACNPGGSSSWLNSGVGDAYNSRVDSRSSVYVSEVAAGAHVADVIEYGMPVHDGDWSSRPRVTVNCTAGWCNGTSRDGMSVPLPPNFHWSPGSDHASSIWDQGGGNVYGVWDCSSLTSTTLTCQDVSRSPDDGNLNGVTTTGSGIEPRAGILTRADLDAGEATHALVFSSGAGNCGSSFRWPATKTDANQFGPCAATPVPEGARFVLDPTVDVNALNVPAWEKVAYRAMQTHGWILNDHGGSSNNGAFLRLSDDTGVPDYAALHVPWSRVRVVT